VTIPPNAAVTLSGHVWKPNTETNVFRTSLTNSLNQPGLYWLTWRAGSSNAPNDGWEIFIHDAQTVRELHHFVSDEPMRFKWRADWQYGSSTVGPGETMERVLLLNDGMTEPGNTRIADGVLRIKMIAHPLAGNMQN
jgi:hypothetical protein